jgi:hypothetical protein
VALVVVATAATWLLSDVSASEAARFVLFEAGYSILPGCLLYLMLTPEPGGWLKTLAVGWPCGYALVVGWFALTAALQIRPAFAFLPLIASLAMGPVVYRRTVQREAGRVAGLRAGPLRGDGRGALLVAAAIAGALVVLAFTFFAPAPLPGHARSVVYGADNLWAISIAAEARHHWPITEAWVAGQPFHYYTGAFIHMAAINQVTGIPLATVALRLFPSVMFFVAALQLWFLGSAMGRSRWVGPLASVLLLVARDINLDPSQIDVLHVSPFTQFSLSASFAFGVPFLLGLLAIVQSWLPTERSATLRAGARLAWGSPGARGLLALVVLLALGCSAAKAFAVADAMGGLTLFWLWCLATGRPLRLISYATVGVFAAGLVIYFVMLRGGTAGTLGVHPLDFLTSADTPARARAALQSVLGHSFLWILVLIAAAPVVAMVAFAPILGALWLLFRRELISPFAVLCICMFASGALAYVTLGAPGGVEGVFLVYGYIALLPVAALGLVTLWTEIPSGARAGAARSCCAVLAVALAAALALSDLAPSSSAARDASYAVAYGLVAIVVVAIVGRGARLYTPTISSPPGRVLACLVPLLVTLSLVKPIVLTVEGTTKAVLHRQVAEVNSPTSYGMTTALYEGLVWVRAHSSSCDVLAVSNHLIGPPPAMSLYFYYSAFAERRIFLESWYYTPNGTRFAQPFPARFALNNEATVHGSASALRRLGEDGVEYVLIDKLHGGGAREPAGVSRLVFDNKALDVYRIISARQSQSCS